MDEKKYTFENPEYRKTYWHSCSHIMAQAVKRLWPEVRLAIGPSIDEGWYYDLSAPFAFTPEHLEKIEGEMRKICKEKLKIERFELPRDEALELMKDEPFKVELINDLPEGETISFYKQGEFTDLCAGPHLDSTGRVKGNALKLTACNAAYWRGDSSRETLQRIYGIAFPKKDELDEYLARIEEAKKRDHRRLGKELGLFMLRDEGPGFPFFLPKGMVLKNTLLEYWREVHKKYGYVEISTPIMLNRQLWERSGHWDHYKNNMYTTVIDDVDFAVKPMNCPGGMLVYASEPHSYRDLPLRVGEIGLVHRHELSGALHGLFRVRCFNQDDAHVFMTREQMQDVIQETVRLFDEVYSTFGLSYTIELSTMPEDHIGTVEEWERNQDILKAAITDMGKDFVINEGDGAFYGPKLDFHLADSLGRTWQCGTIQLDSQLPERFELEYTGADGEKHRPVMIHRVVLGSIERFIGVITEHFAGAFPTWLAPVQVKVMNITDRTADYARSVCARLDEAGIRAECDLRNEKIGYKIREAQMQKIPYMLVAGDREAEAGAVAVRTRGGVDLGAMPLDEFVGKILAEVKEKAR
ncbi:MAG: threonine--tRNA ligase [Butyricicoccus sp.]|nr:threonine--tRNA ligase [Butyricicoccus sp.]